MSRKEPQTRCRAGFSLMELVAVLAIIAVMVAILFPVFQKVRSGPNGAVRDSLGRPIPGAVLRFRDSSGRLVLSITTDDYGSFRVKGLNALSQDPVDGFGLTRVQRRSGSSDLYTYTPLGAQIATFQDEAGKPVASLAVNLLPAPRTWQHYPLEASFQPKTDKAGTVKLTNVPSGARLLIQSNDQGYVVEKVQISVSGNTIRYTVAVSSPATITGRVLSPSGRPLRGYKSFASLGPDFEHHDRYYARWLLTGKEGRYDIHGLPPGTYYVRAALAHGVQSVTPVKRVVVRSGQTAQVSLRAADEADAL